MSTHEPLIRVQAWPRWLREANLALLLAVLTLVVPATYVGNEHLIYYWDYASYEDQAIADAASWRAIVTQSPVAIIHLVAQLRASTGNSYSELPAAVSAPFLAVFGGSRLTYIASAALMYLLPYALAIGALASRLLRTGTRVHWPAAFLTLLLPPAWLPTLRGYPDTGAALLMLAASLVYLRERPLPRLNQALLIGTLVALAILFRRHFAYAAVALFLTTLVTPLIGSVTRRDGLQRLKRVMQESVGQTLLFGASTFAALILFGAPFLASLRETNFSQLYASWEWPFETNFVYYLTYPGILNWTLALGGFAIGLSSRTLDRRVAGFILLLTFFGLAQWTLLVKQLGIQYTLHFTPCLVLGLAALLHSRSRIPQRWARPVFVALICGFLIVNGTNALAVPLFGAPGLELDRASVVPTPYRLSGLGVASLFAASYPPEQRADSGELERLVGWLRRSTTARQAVVVAGSSEVLSDDLLWHADRVLDDELRPTPAPDPARARLDILHWLPFARSQDPYPLESLLRAQKVLIGDPFQLHLRPEEQSVMQVVGVAFAQDWEISRDFELQPVEFTLDRGVGVRVYQRLYPTSSSVAVHTLARIESYVGQRPPQQADWIGLSESGGYHIVREAFGTYGIEVDAGTPRSSGEITFVHLGVPAASVVVTGALHSGVQCAGMRTIRAAGVDRNGVAGPFSQTTLGPGVSESFQLTVSDPDAAYLLLAVRSGDAVDTALAEGECAWGLSGLTVAS